MAVTSIWSIKGWIGKVIKYAENPDKTKENNEGQISENQSQSTQGLEDVITYAVNTEKMCIRDRDKKDQVLLDDGEGVEIEPEQKKKERER